MTHMSHSHKQLEGRWLRIIQVKIIYNNNWAKVEKITLAYRVSHFFIKLFREK